MRKQDNRPLPVHPNEVLEEEFLKPLGLSHHRLALDLGVVSRLPPAFGKVTGDDGVGWCEISG